MSSLKLITSSEREYKKIIYIISLIGALGGLLFGLDQGFIANSLETIIHVYNLDTFQGEQYSAVLAWGGIIGALLSGFFARYNKEKRSKKEFYDSKIFALKNRWVW